MKDRLQKSNWFINPEKYLESANSEQILIVTIVITVCDEEETTEFLNRLMKDTGENDGN